MARDTSAGNRRHFLKQAATAAAGFWVAGRSASAADLSATAPGQSPSTQPATAPASRPSDAINVGFVGVANQGSYDLSETANVPGVNVAALCDVNDNYLGDAGKRFPKARKFNDYRRMLDEVKELDAVVIAIPDHMHAFVTLAAMESGKHVYCEKPLTHSVREARVIAQTAKRLKRVTQMGTQIHAMSNYRRVVELIEARAIGPVREVHVWSSAMWSADDLPTDTPAVPSYLHYDLWQGSAESHAYSPSILPANWRRFWNYGNGSLGDMGCHYQDLAFWALKLRHPDRISAEGPPVHAEGCPLGLTVTYEYAARGDLPALSLKWYDGGKRPEQFKEWGLRPQWSAGVMFVGDKGMLFSDYNEHHLFPKKDFADYTPPKQTIPDSVGHHHEFIDACRRNDPHGTLCNFDYAGALTEAVLLGAVAYRVGKPIEWDATALKVTNVPEAEPLVAGHYREGWKLG